MKLFIFEPYEWAYCGGAIGVVAETYEDAVEFIIENDKQRCLKAKKRIEEKYKNTEKRWRPIVRRVYRREYFGKSPEKFKKDQWDQWLLTQTVKVAEEEESRIVFDNWNNA